MPFVYLELSKENKGMPTELVDRGLYPQHYSYRQRASPPRPAMKKISPLISYTNQRPISISLHIESRIGGIIATLSPTDIHKEAI